MTQVLHLPGSGEMALAALIGRSPAIKHLCATVRRVAQSNLPVLILGPSGAGKELAAYAVHAASGRRGAWVPFNVCAIPESTFESAVFGHVRGAFTGATADHPGYLVEADRGTAFFDEIGAVSPMSQSKLLRAVETHVFRPMGSRADRHSDFRLIAATNADLDRLVAEGRFRADLLHRLSAGAVLRVPALAERPEDVPLLAEHFVGQIAADLGRVVRLEGDAMARLCSHEWPGNVRELQAVINRAVVLGERDALHAGDVEAALCTRCGNGVPGHGSAPRLNAAVEPLFAAVRAAEAAAIAAALAQAKGDRAAAAALLGISVATLRRRLARLRCTPLATQICAAPLDFARQD